MSFNLTLRRAADRGSTADLVWQRADGSGPFEKLIAPESSAGARAWTGDGKSLIFSASVGGRRHLMAFRPAVDSSALNRDTPAASGPDRIACSDPPRSLPTSLRQRRSES